MPLHELWMVALDALLSILLCLLSIHLLPLCWFSIVQIECLMEYLRTPALILDKTFGCKEASVPSWKLHVQS